MIRTILLLLAVTLTHPAFAGVQTTVHMKHVDRNGKVQKHQAEISMQDGNYKMDFELPNGQGKISHIRNRKSGKTYAVMHSMKRVTILPNKEKNPFFFSKKGMSLEAAKAAGYKTKKIGRDKVEGYACDLYMITSTKGDGIQNGTACFADKLDGLVLKMEGKDEDGSTVKFWLKNPKSKSFSQATFQPPKKWKTNSIEGIGAFSQGNIMNQMQKMQSLPPAQRKAAMEQWKQMMKKKAQQMGRGQ